MAKKAKGDRNNPKQNKSLAIRLVLKAKPKAKAAEVAQAVKAQYGHKVSPTFVYLVRSKSNVRKAGRKAAKSNGTATAASMGSASDWVGAIRLARALLQCSGSVENATAILRAVEG